LAQRGDLQLPENKRLSADGHYFRDQFCRWSAVLNVGLALKVEVGLPMGAGHASYTPAVHEMVRALLGGDAGQWPTLMTEVHALALVVCQRRAASQDLDFAGNVALRVIERLQRDDYQALRRFEESRLQTKTLTFEMWTRGIIHNALIDELRSLPTFGRTRRGAGREVVRRPHVMYEDQAHSESQSSTGVFDARRVLRWIHDEEFPAAQRSALLLWLHGHSIEGCSREMKLGESEIRKLLRAARQRLRRQFKEPS